MGFVQGADLGGDLLGVVVHGVDGGVAALVDGAQGFLLQGGDTAGLVPGGGVALTDLLAHQAQGLLIAVDDLKDALPDLRRGGAAGQDVLGADELGGLAEDGGAALPDHQVESWPMSTLAARPLVGSEPPHSVPTMSSERGNSSFWSREASATISLA